MGGAFAASIVVFMLVAETDSAAMNPQPPIEAAEPPNETIPQKPITEIETRELRLLDQASTLLSKGKVSDALKVLENIDGEFLHDDAARPVWAWTLYESKQYEQLLRDLPQASENPELSFLRATALFHQGDQKAGRKALQALWRRYPTAAWGQWSLWTLAKEKAGPIYSKSERRFILNTVPPPRFKLRARAQTIASNTL